MAAIFRRAIEELDHQRQVQGQVQQGRCMHLTRSTKASDTAQGRDAGNLFLILQELE